MKSFKINIKESSKFNCPLGAFYLCHPNIQLFIEGILNNEIWVDALKEHYYKRFIEDAKMQEYEGFVNH
jgi:hypothetical protein